VVGEQWSILALAFREENWRKGGKPKTQFGPVEQEFAMNTSKQFPFTGNSGFGFSLNEARSPAEETLRLIASLPAPEGFAERVEAGLRLAPRSVSVRARILAWPVALRLDHALDQPWLRTAAAAAIVAVVAGGGWGISARFQPPPPASAVTLPPRVSAPGGFSSAKAMRTPQTLIGPTVADLAAAHPALAAPPASKTDGQTAAQTSTLHRGKPASAQKTIAPPVALAAK
jgi:hypothetical protein